MQRRFVRGLASLVFGAALLAGSLISGVGSRASAQEPALVLFGSVAPVDGALPSRIRATVGDVVCGSSVVIPGPNGLGSYALAVVSADTKVGCGIEGSLVRLRVLHGEVDGGRFGGLAVWQSGETQQLDLAGALLGVFVGALPDGPGRALLLWTGESGVPVEQALRTIPRVVDRAYLWDGTRGSERGYVAGAPSSAQTYSTVDSGDIVVATLR